MPKGMQGVRLVLTASLVLLIAACGQQIRAHGYVPPAEQLDALAIGADTRETVAAKVGQPAATGIDEAGNWYYVESKFRHFAFLEPAEISREVLVISFGRGGRLANIQRFGLEQGRVVTISQRVTELTPTRTRTFVERLLGRIGRASGAGLFSR